MVVKRIARGVAVMKRKSLSIFLIISMLLLQTVYAASVSWPLYFPCLPYIPALLLNDASLAVEQDHQINYQLGTSRINSSYKITNNTDKIQTAVIGSASQYNLTNRKGIYFQHEIR